MEGNWDIEQQTELMLVEGELSARVLHQAFNTLIRNILSKLGRHCFEPVLSFVLIPQIPRQISHCSSHRIFSLLSC